MKRKNASLTASCAALGIFVLILDSGTALAGAAKGIDMCIRTVIPSLFPFFVLSDLLTSNLLGSDFRILRPLGRLFGMPRGSESIFLVGILGGYPVGARCISTAWKDGTLSYSDAGRMLGFCSNAGPAFLFGMAAFLFSDKTTPWVLFAIQVLSAVAAGCVLPGKSSGQITVPRRQKNISQALYSSLKAIATVCGWIILFRVLLTFCERWFFWLFPVTVQAALFGLLELSNGIFALQEISSQAVRFVLCSVMLSLGGLCVTMQTVSVTDQLGLGAYLPGKLLQGVCSLFLSSLLSFFLWELPFIWLLIASGFLFLSVGVLLWRKDEKNSSISRACVV